MDAETANPWQRRGRRKSAVESSYVRGSPADTSWFAPTTPLLSRQRRCPGFLLRKEVTP